MTNVVPQYMRNVDYAEQLRLRSLSLRDAVHELRYIGPYFAAAMEEVDIVTIRHLIKYLDVDDESTVYNRLTRMLQNDRRNLVVRRATSPRMVGDVNPRAFNSIIHLLRACVNLTPRSPLRHLTQRNIPLYYPALSFSSAHCRAHNKAECGGGDVRRYCKWERQHEEGICRPTAHNARGHEEVGADDSISASNNSRYTAAKYNQTQTVDRNKPPIRSGRYVGGWRSPGYIPKRQLVRQ